MGEARRRRERGELPAPHDPDRAEKRKLGREMRRIAAAVTPVYVREAPGIGRAKRRRYDREHRA